MPSDFDDNNTENMTEEQVAQAAEKMDEIIGTLEQTHKWLEAAPDFNKLAECFTIATLAWHQRHKNSGVADVELRRIVGWLHSWYVDCVMVGMVLTGQTGIAYPEESNEPLFARPQFDEEAEEPDDDATDEA